MPNVLVSRRIFKNVKQKKSDISYGKLLIYENDASLTTQNDISVSKSANTVDIFEYLKEVSKF